MNVSLLAHYGLGMLVVLMGVLFVWRRGGRRIMLYLLTLQIILGIAVVYSGLRAPWYHYGLAVLAWAGYMLANALDRRQKGAPVLTAAAISTIIVLLTFYIGMHSVKVG